MKLKKFLGIAAIIAVIGFITLPLTGCPEADDGGGGDSGGPVVPSGLSISDAIPLAFGVWANGSILEAVEDEPDGEQWFKFTATETSHYIHVGFGTLTGLNIQLYENDETDEVGTSSAITSSTTNKYINQTSLTVDNEYYIKVTPSSGKSGTFKIGFNNTSFVPPGVTTLESEIWADGNIAPSDGEQWFKFTATASLQYIHVSFGTLTDLYVQVYGSNGTEVGTKTNLYSSTTNTSRTTTADQEYYIKITPYYSSGSGTYKIAFNTSTTLPAITLPTENLISLTADTWADGNIPTSTDEQWFKFTATDNPTYIHFSPDTLTSVNVNVYNSSGNIVGNQINLTSSTKLSIRATTASQEYYIKITPYNGSGSGAYKIAFSASIVTLGKTATQLTAYTWADGNIPISTDEQWFKFTAIASTQYIHVSFGTLTDLYVQVYGSNGTEVGTKTNLYSSTTNINRTTAVDQEYYIKVTPYSNSGTYKIAFNTSTTMPAAITLPTENLILLTANTWADGNIPTSTDEQWFKFTATDNPTYIHFSPDTLTSVNVNVYNSSGNIVGNQINLTSSTKLSIRATTASQEYYIKITPSNSSYSGAYKIAFNAFFTLGKTATQLTADTWADGSIASSSDEQWFKFTATANTQYIHIQMTVTTTTQLYNSDGSTQGSAGTWYSNEVSYGRSQETLVNGQTYYIRITCSSSHNYKITFSASNIALPTIKIPSTGVTELTAADTWVNGNIATEDGEQWFKFTATVTGTQYIHFQKGTLNDVYVELFVINGTGVINGSTIGSKTNLYGSTLSTSRTVTSGTVYYIKVTPYGTGSGAFKIGFNTSATAPSTP